MLFPKPIDGFITKNVLVETLMEGVPINAFMALHDDLSSYAHKLKMKLSDLGCRLVLKMVFFDNYIHGDLHPGWFQRCSGGLDGVLNGYLCVSMQAILWCRFLRMESRASSSWTAASCTPRRPSR